MVLHIRIDDLQFDPETDSTGLLYSFAFFVAVALFGDLPPVGGLAPAAKRDSARHSQKHSTTHSTKGSQARAAKTSRKPG